MLKLPYLPSLFGNFWFTATLFLFLNFTILQNWKLKLYLQPQHQWMGVHGMLGHAWRCMVRINLWLKEILNASLIVILRSDNLFPTHIGVQCAGC